MSYLRWSPTSLPQVTLYCCLAVTSEVLIELLHLLMVTYHHSLIMYVKIKARIYGKSLWCQVTLTVVLCKHTGGWTERWCIFTLVCLFVKIIITTLTSACPRRGRARHGRLHNAFPPSIYYAARWHTSSSSLWKISLTSSILNYAPACRPWIRSARA